MVDIDTRMKIEKLIRECYDRTFDIIKKIENTPDESHVFRTLIIENTGVDHIDKVNYMKMFATHYQGVFEGLFTALYENDFDRYPSPEEIVFIQEQTQKDWEKLVDLGKKFALLEYAKK